jgi:predicted nuclease of predicted toxin-antitoxin system
MAWKVLEKTPQHEIDAFVRNWRKKARFLVDESLGVEVARLLRDAGWNAKYVGEVRLSGRSDEDVFAFAWSDDRILLTHDADFLDDRAFPPHRNPGVVVLPGAQGETERLLKGLAFVLSVVGRFREGYRGTKVLVNADGSWTIIDRNLGTGVMERTKFRTLPHGPVEIWVGDEDSP